jgi:hypothetical protein
MSKVDMPGMIAEIAEAEVGNRYRVVTSEGHEIEGEAIQNDSDVHDELVEIPSVWLMLSISQKVSDELGSVWADIRMDAEMKNDEWEDVVVYYVKKKTNQLIL